MPSKNNLTDMKNAASKPKVLFKSELSDTSIQNPTHTDDHDRAGDNAKQSVGRPKKPKKSVRNYKVLVSFTEDQREQLKQDAGLANIATYIYSKLIEHDIIAPEYD